MQKTTSDRLRGTLDALILTALFEWCPSRLRDFQMARRSERPRPEGRGGHSLSRALPPGATRLDRGRMGDVGARAAGSFLSADPRR